MIELTPICRENEAALALAWTAIAPKARRSRDNCTQLQRIKWADGIIRVLRLSTSPAESRIQLEQAERKIH